MYLSVIIPAYDEEKRLPETLTKVRDYLSRQDYSFEVLIVNDGSKDRTAAVVSELIKEWGGFRLIDNKENKGKGGVVKQGMLEAKGDWRMFMDADGSTDLSEIGKLWPYTSSSSRQYLQTRMPKGGSSRPSEASLPTRSASSFDHATRPARVSLEDTGSFHPYEIVIGSRYLKKDSIKIKQPLGRKIVSRMGNWLTRILLGLDMVDTQCGFKLFSARAANEIFPLQTIDRWGFDMEVLAIARKKSYQIKEVAVDWYDAEGSLVKKSAAWKTLRELIIIKWNLVRGLYNSIDKTS